MAICHVSNMKPASMSRQQCLRHLQVKYGSLRDLGPGPRLRLAAGYLMPAEHYERCVDALVGPDTSWLDVGGGRELLPHNARLAERLFHRARRIVAVDPSPNVRQNEHVHERHACLLEDFAGTQRFDLATLRMVAEHVEDPPALLDRLATLVNPGGRVVVFTVHRWSPVTLASQVLPFALHHRIKRAFWGGEPADTFPTRYRMNTRRRLASLFADAGFTEQRFEHLDDLSVLSQFPRGHRLELALRHRLRRLGLRYPECCLLGVYRRNA